MLCTNWLLVWSLFDVASFTGSFSLGTLIWNADLVWWLFGGGGTTVSTLFDGDIYSADWLLLIIGRNSVESASLSSLLDRILSRVNKARRNCAYCCWWCNWCCWLYGVSDCDGENSLVCSCCELAGASRKFSGRGKNSWNSPEDDDDDDDEEELCSDDCGRCALTCWYLLFVKSVWWSYVCKCEWVSWCPWWGWYWWGWYWCFLTGIIMGYGTFFSIVYGTGFSIGTERNVLVQNFVCSSIELNWLTWYFNFDRYVLDDWIGLNVIKIWKLLPGNFNRFELIIYLGDMDNLAKKKKYILY